MREHEQAVATSQAGFRHPTSRTALCCTVSTVLSCPNLVHTPRDAFCTIRVGFRVTIGVGQSPPKDGTQKVQATGNMLAYHLATQRS